MCKRHDFDAALREVSPSAMREILGRSSKCGLAGPRWVEEVKKVVEAVERPLRNADSFRRLGIEAPKGILLPDRPVLARPCWPRRETNESEANFITVKAFLPSLQAGRQRARKGWGRDLQKGKRSGAVIFNLPWMSWGCAAAHAWGRRRPAARHRARGESTLKRDGMVLRS